MQEKVNINSASIDEIAQIPGVGQTTARSIVDFRDKHGKFRTLDDLARVQQLKPEHVNVLRKYVRI